MSNPKSELAGLVLGTVAGALALNWWNQRNTVKTSTQTDTGNKTSDGNSIVEVTGVGGADNGVKVQGYVLPTNIADIKLPLSIVVKPNGSLLFKNGGDKITFTSKLNDELMFVDSGTQNAVWLPDLAKAALGAV